MPARPLPISRSPSVCRPRTRPGEWYFQKPLPSPTRCRVQHTLLLRRARVARCRGDGQRAPRRALAARWLPGQPAGRSGCRQPALAHGFHPRPPRKRQSAAWSTHSREDAASPVDHAGRGREDCRLVPRPAGGPAARAPGGRRQLGGTGDRIVDRRCAGGHAGELLSHRRRRGDRSSAEAARPARALGDRDQAFARAEDRAGLTPGRRRRSHAA